MQFPAGFRYGNTVKETNIRHKKSMRFFNLFEPFQKKHIQLGYAISVISGRSENAEVDTEKILTDSPMVDCYSSFRIAWQVYLANCNL